MKPTAARIPLCPDCAAHLAEFRLSSSTHVVFEPATLARLARFVGPDRGQLTAAERREARALKEALIDGLRRTVIGEGERGDGRLSRGGGGA